MRKLILLMVLLLVACNPENADPAGTGPPPSYQGISADHLPDYRSSFVVQFEGRSPWTYQLDSRSDGVLVEHVLQIEGVPVEQNPGDIRAILQNDVIQIHGPGTEGQCLQFPKGLDIGPAFLTPDILLAPDLVAPHLTDQGGEKIAGMSARRYGLRQPELGAWKNALVDIWWADSTGAALRYDLRLEGFDPLFNSGEGVLSARYQVVEFGPQDIEPLPGCAIDYPLPENATGLVKLPGLVAFESPDSVEEITSFYQAELAGEGWAPEEEPQTAAGVVLLSYQREGETLAIKIEDLQGLTAVEIISNR